MLHDSLLLTAPLIVGHITIVYFYRPLYRSALHDSLLLSSRIIVGDFAIIYYFHELLSISQTVTPACAAEKRGHAFYAPVFQSAPRGVKKDSLNLPRFYARFPAQF